MTSPYKLGGGRSRISTAAWATRLAWRSAPGFLLGLVAVTLVGAAIPVGTLWLTKLILDRLVAPGTLEIVAALAVGLAVAGLVGSMTPQTGQYLRAELDRRVALRAQDQLFAAVERLLGLARFEDPAFLDRLRLAQQSAASPGQIVDSVLGLGQGALMLAGLLGSLVVISPPFTGMVLAAGIPALLVELRLSRRRATLQRELSQTERREWFYSDLLGSGHAAKEIRLFGLGPFLRARMTAEQRTANLARHRLDKRELVLQSGLALTSAVIAGAGLVWVILSADRGHASVGDVALFVAALAGVQGAVSGLVTSISESHFQLLLFGNFVDVLETAPDLPLPAEPKDISGLTRGIQLTDVWFRYSDDHPWVLRGVNLFIPAGCSVALVGHNGSGKSSLVKLLCRFYDPTKGTIRWDGTDLRDVPVEDLRARIGAVFQDFVNYDFSAADNIAVGDLSALGSTSRIEVAARRAGVHDALTGLPRGYETMLTRAFFDESDTGGPETGVMLSGGQWQRLALARAFLRSDRDLMILDEPSAGLDAEAEHEMHTRLRETRTDRTSLLISHRLGTVRDADLIVVLADGKITERGRHAELIAADGTYARLFTLQASGYADDPEDGRAGDNDLADPLGGLR